MKSIQCIYSNALYSPWFVDLESELSPRDLSWFDLNSSSWKIYVTGYNSPQFTNTFWQKLAQRELLRFQLFLTTQQLFTMCHKRDSHITCSFSFSSINQCQKITKVTCLWMASTTPTELKIIQHNLTCFMSTVHELQRIDGLHIEHMDSPVRPLARGSSVDMYVYDHTLALASLMDDGLHIQGVFFNWYLPKKLKYGKPRLGVSTLTLIGRDTPNLAQINFFVLRTFRGGTS